jgi:hypothetical protein
MNERQTAGKGRYVMPRQFSVWGLGVLGCLAGAGALAGPDDGGFDRTPKECVQVAAIRRTEVLDDRTVLFFMRGGAWYRNYLRRDCPGLAREGRFLYSPVSGRLCNTHGLTLLQDFNGEFVPTIVCPLGDFQPVTPEEVADLKRGEHDKSRKDGLRQSAVRVEPAEVPGEKPKSAAPEQR